MTTEFLIATLFNLGVNIFQTMIALVVGIMVLQWIDKKLLKKLDIEDELQKGNVAVAIFASTILLFVAVIIAFGLRG